MRYSFHVEIDYQEDRKSIFIQLVNQWTGEIVFTGESIPDRKAVLSCIDYMLEKHLPEPK